MWGECRYILIFLLGTFTVEHANMHQKKVCEKALQTEPKRPYWCLHCSAMGAIKLSLVAMSTIMELLIVPEKKEKRDDI